eukprot:GCRY01000524.1.p1 GENE.GCRY01000524.1~~GCRY01000524.1.p1  ORF type:complete len:225 (-),score=40.71 GCRY01000524.1:119-793(-)
MDGDFPFSAFDSSSDEDLKSPKIARICQGCNRPRRTCLCDSFPKEPLTLINTHKVVILQHPAETRALRTSPLIERCLGSFCEVIVGRKFPATKFPELHQTLSSQTTCLLYPSSSSIPLADFCKSCENKINLVVVDGTWEYAKNMLTANKFFDSIQHVSLPIQTDYFYTIRKQPQLGFVSTLEAVAAALEIIEQSAAPRKALLLPLQEMVRHQRACAEGRKQAAE